MKEWVTVTIVLLLVILLVACGSNGNFDSRLSDTERNTSPAHDLAESNASVDEARIDFSDATTDPPIVEQAQKQKAKLCQL